MSEFYPMFQPESSDPETRQEPREMVVTGLYSQEELVAMALAVAEIDSDITIETIDPNDDTEFGRYASAVSMKEHGEEYNGGFGFASEWDPRTPEEVTREVQPYAISQGFTAVILRHTGNDLRDFWARQREILAQREE